MFTREDVVFTYTRAQAIEDGVLIDVTGTAKQAGWKWPVALTRAAWDDFVAWSNEDTRRKNWPQDEDGRLWDVIFMGACAARQGAGGDDQATFDFLRVPREGKARQARRVTARLHCGPGDNGAPAVTIMLPGES